MHCTLAFSSSTPAGHICGTQQLVPPDINWLHSDEFSICIDAVVDLVTPYGVIVPPLMNVEIAAEHTKAATPLLAKVPAVWG